MFMTESIDVRTRITVLQAALMVEYFSTFFLAALLGIEDFRKTKTFAGSSALSFNAKINMLIDIEAIDAENRKVFQRFMEIRNVFMHDLSAKTYKDCVDRIEGAETFLLKRYTPNTTQPLENQLNDAIIGLCSEVNTLLQPAYEKLKAKIEADVTNKMNRELKEYYFVEMKKHAMEASKLKKQIETRLTVPAHTKKDEVNPATE
jgi:hypothetical protein